jgi:hypothetical protein
MADLPPGLARMPSDASLTMPPHGAWCRACRGTRRWTERHEPKGWCCMTCHPQNHLRPDQIRREGQGASLPPPSLRGSANVLLWNFGKLIAIAAYTTIYTGNVLIWNISILVICLTGRGYTEVISRRVTASAWQVSQLTVCDYKYG